MSFWDKARPGGQAPPPQPQYAPPAQQSYPPQQYQQQPVAPPPAEQYAVDIIPGRGHDPMAGQIRERGFIRRAPEWMTRQPSERCPECHMATYALTNGSENGYGKPATVGGGKDHPLISFEYRRCFACGHSSTGMSNRQSTNGGQAGRQYRPRQTAHGGAQLTNFGEIKGSYM